MSDKPRLVICIMGENCERFIKMSLESVKDADVIIYCDGGSTDNTLRIVDNFEYGKRLTDKYINGEQLGTINSVIIINNEYNQEDKTMNGKQRNFYLDYLKKNHINDWCLVLDSDEVLEDFGIEKLKQTILPIKKDMIFSPRIHHFVGDLGYEDYTKDIHYYQIEYLK